MKKIIVTLSLMVGCVVARGEEAASVVPVNLGLCPPVQIADVTDDVHGFQLGVLWGESRDLYGVSVGVLGNFAHRSFEGVELALGCNWAESGFGIAWAGAFNRVGGDFSGWTRTLGANICEGTFRGYQDALCSNYARDLHGLQIALVNAAHAVHGVQIGLINLTEDMYGVQVGVLNFIRNSALPFFPIVNAYF